MVLSPEHPLVEKLTTPDHRAKVDGYLERTAKQDLVTRKTSTEKTGVFTGSYAINPATGRENSRLDRGLRADGVRDWGDHGRPCA
jgi:leucyl-tRNA synthetase